MHPERLFSLLAENVYTKLGIREFSNKVKVINIFMIIAIIYSYLTSSFKD